MMGQFIKKHLFGNMTAKVMALAMAVAVWLYAQSFSHVHPAEFEVPVVVSLPRGWSLASRTETTVNVTLTYLRRFDRAVSQAYDAQKIMIRCEAPPVEGGADEQTIGVPLKPSDLAAPKEFAIRVVKFSPEELPVTVTREASKSLLVRPEFSAPPPGYQLTDWRTAPRMVMVRGRKAVLANVTEIRTEEIDITSPPPVKKTEWVDEQTVPVAQYVVVDDARHAVKCDAQVKCRIILTRVAKSRSFKDQTINLLAPPDYKHLAELARERKTTVTVSGPADVVEALKPENIVLYVDVGRLEPPPEELAYTQPIQAHIVNTPGARDLAIKLGTETCAVKVSEKPAR